MANKPDKKEKLHSPEAMISSQQERPRTNEEYDPLSEESTDYRAPGKKFETLGEGKNLDLSRMDQPRTGTASMPERLTNDVAEYATRRPLDATDEEERKLFEERQKRKKKVA